MAVPFSADAHHAVGEDVLLKRAPEDLSRVIANWDEVRRTFAPHPCLSEMLTDTRRRIFDDCGIADSRVAPGVGDMRIPCGGCSWRTPIVDEDGEPLDDAVIRDQQQQAKSRIR